MIYRFVSLILLFVIAFESNAQFGPDIDQSVKLTAEVNVENESITIHWIVDERAVSFDLYKRKYGDESWGSKIDQFDTNTTSFTDTNILPNERYEYKIQKFTEENIDGFGYILTGISLAPIHSEGNILLVLTQTTYQNVENKILEFQDILTADGWPNRILIVPNGLLVSEVKSRILEEFDIQPFTNCLLLGDVPIALSGDVAPDGHTTKRGAWAADLYYGDIDGEWTDSLVNTTVSPWPVNNNIPGDGKLDQSTIPSDIDIALGRVDFSNLPIFEEDEYELLSKYIDKNIAYRTKEKEIRRRAAIYNINPWEGALGQNGIRNFSTIVSPDSILYDDFAPLWEESFLWLYAASSGFHNLLFTVTTSEELSQRPLKAVFTNFFGSRFGNYDYEDNFMRSALGSGDVLSSCWVGAPHWYFHSMAMGYSLGHATITTQNNDTIYSSGNNVKSIHVNLLGDPTLKLFPMEKIANLDLVENQSFIQLNWSPSSDAEGYFVYRKSEGESDFEVLNDIPIAGTSYQDPCPTQGQAYTYMVRGTRIETTPSGTYYNLSTGAMNSISSQLNHDPIAGFDLLSQDGEVILINQSENWDTVLISGVDEVVDQNDGSYILIDAENGDVITLIAMNDCGMDTISLEVVITNIEELEKYDVSVYPNPASSTIQISSELTIHDWNLHRLDGSLLKSKVVDSKLVSIDVSKIAAGIYNLILSTAEGEVNKRIIIE